MAGGFDLLGLQGVWLPAVPGPPASLPPNQRGEVLVRAYHGESGEYLETWDEHETIEIAFAEFGPDTGRIVIPRTAPYTHRSRSAPGGVGVFLEIDGRGVDAPVWTGRMEAAQYSGDGPDLTAQLAGPASWLSEIGIGDLGKTNEPASMLIRRAFEMVTAPTFCRVDPESTYVGLPSDDQPGGSDLWALATGVTAARGEEIYLTADAGQIAYRLAVRHPLGSPDLSAECTLEHGRNCTLSSSASNLKRPKADLIGVANSYLAGSGLHVASVTAPAGARVGMLAALSAPISGATARGLTGGPTAQMSPETPTIAALELELATMLRRSLAPTLVAQIADVDPSLWKYMRPGYVVGCRLPDPQGWFENALLRIRTVAFRLAPDLGCSITGDLWRVEGHHA